MSQQPGESDSFLDAQTLSELKWQEIWEQWSPITHLGQRQKAVLKPFLPGDEAEWQRSYDVLETDVAALTDTLQQRTGDLLRQIPDISDILRRLQNIAVEIQREQIDFVPLQARDMLVLKHFALLGQRLAQTLQGQIDGVWSEDVWTRWLKPFGKPEQDSFSIGDIATPLYLQASQNYAQALRRRGEAVRRWETDWLNTLGIRPSRDGRIVCRLPADADLARRLKALEGVAWQSDTPFESTFTVPFSEEIEQLQQQQDEWQQVMDVEGNRSLQTVTKILVVDLESWYAAAAEITAIDLRVAKVRLWREWCGCRPELAPGTEVIEGVHPVLASKMANQGRTYIPLNWAPENGINVLTGLNMGGKSLSLRLLVTCQVCAQYALPVPAKGFSTRLFREIRLYGAVSSPAETGLSSFGSEVVQMRSSWLAIQQAAEPVFHCFDEPAKSTNPTEGEALVVGFLKSLQSRVEAKHLVIVATHFPGSMRQAAIAKFRIRGLREVNLKAMLDSGIGQNFDALDHRLRILSEAMDYQVEPVLSSDLAQEALNVAAWLGLPESVLHQSRAYLKENMISDGISDDKEE